MPDERQRLSADELTRLLDDLAPAGASHTPTDELDRTLADILGQGRPVAAASGQPAQKMARGGPAQQVTPQTQPEPVQTAAPARHAEEKPVPKKENIPQQDRRPFTADEHLQLDDNPLVSEDFRRFFTTSVTPDALFSNPVETQSTHRNTGWQRPVRHAKPVQLPVTEAVETEEPAEQPEPEAQLESEAQLEPSAPRKRGKPGLFATLREFFLSDEPAVQEPLPGPSAPEQPADPPQQPLSGPDTGTAIFEKVSTPPVQTGADTGTAIFEKVTPQSAEPSADTDTAIFVKMDALHADTDVFAPLADPAAERTPTTRFDPVGETVEEAPARQTAEADPAEESSQDSAPAEDIFAPAAPTVFTDVEELAEEAAPIEELAEETAPVEEIAETAPAGAQEPSQPADSDGAGESDPAQWENDDYYAAAQRPAIAATLRSMVVGLTVRSAVLGILAAVSLWFGLAAAFPALPQPTGLVPASVAGVFTMIVLVASLLIGGLVSLPILQGGLRGLLEDATVDSFAALSWCGALLQALVLLLQVGKFDPARPVYAAFALLALFTATLGKRSLAANVRKNFEQLTDDGANYAVAALLQDAGLVRRLTHGLGEAEPYLLVSRPTGFYDGFLHQSFGTRQGDRAARAVCRLLPAAALVAGILGLILDSGFVQPFTAVLCIGCPLAMVLVSAVPAYFMNKSARAVGTILPGPAALEDLGQANVVVTAAADLFPADSVTLKGMKVFGQTRIDLAILYAASLLVPQCSTLRGVFMNIIQNRTELLYEVENLNVELGCGLEGWVDSRHLLVGNRGMMISHGVQVPPQDYEARYTRDGRYSPVYLAVNGRLAAMFVVGYRPDPKVKALLDEVYVSGLSLLVTSDDFNLTGERIDTVYGIPSGCIKVLGVAESQRLAACTAPCEHCTGAMVHTATSLSSYLEGIRIAASAAGMEKAACTIQTASVAVSTLLVFILTCTGGLTALGTAAILLYQLAWLVLTLLLPCAKQY